MVEKRETVQTFFDAGGLKSEHTEVEGKKDGMSRQWYTNGQLMSEAEYQNGLAHGQLKEWSENGQLIMLAERRNGQLDGHFQSWWNNGESKEDGYYANGKRQPGYRWFRADGTPWTDIPPESAT